VARARPSPGQRNAPLLDSIAWYGGNCGVDFDVEGGEDITGSFWREKQYEHTRGGTHPVQRRLPNPLGLFDMLGNVYEWCEDWEATARAQPTLAALVRASSG
jgi:formylglycine-generating enzyme required for sulfatase activity